MLNLGKTVYTENCMACHGVDGDGKKNDEDNDKNESELASN